MLFIPTIMSQNSYYDYYFNVNDTIHGRSPIYHYQWWSENWLSDTNHGLSVQMIITNEHNPHGIDIDSVRGRFFLMPYYYLHGEILRYCYTDEPLNIVGLAASAYVRSSSITSTNDEIFRPEYFRLYDAKTDTFQLVGELQFVNASPKRYIDLDVRELTRIPYYGSQYNTTFCCDEVKPVQHEIKPIHEYYFDKPVTVTDSFYVGHTQLSSCDNYWIPDAPILENRRWFGVYNLSYDTNYNGYVDQNYVYHNPCADMGCEIMPGQLYRFRFINDLNYPLDYQFIPTVFVDTLWHWTVRPHFMLVFPIIEIDSSWRHGPPQYECPEVTDLRVAAVDDAGVIIMWNTRTGQEQWQISHGPAGTPPDSGLVESSHTPACRLRDLDSCTSYDVYVRAVCHHDSTEYSPWTGPIAVNNCDTTNASEAIRQPTALELYTQLIPNPAQDNVNISCSYVIKSCQVLTLDGREVEEKQVNDRYATLDVKGWNPGVYIVVLHTQAGMVSRRLVVK